MLDKNRIPKHVAIIMDGNGRWAKQKNMPRVLGHNAGMKTMKSIVEYSSQLGIKYLTVYAFSTENWKRTEDEIKGIFGLLIEYVDKELANVHENNVRVRIIGDYSKTPKKVISKIDLAQNTTINNTGLQFNIALNYGSRNEIEMAMKSIGKDIEAKVLSSEEITQELISDRLYTGMEKIPDPDVCIRTSGEIRLSNFLLWQLAYSELVFSDVLWPDFGNEEYEKCILEYQNRDRRFGGR